MATVTIEGVPSLDGTYELDLTYFTNRELHLIKKETGVVAGEIESAGERGDNDLLVMLAYIAVTRDGRKIPIDLLWDAPAGKITIDNTSDAEVEDKTLPPVSAREDAG